MRSIKSRLVLGYALLIVLTMLVSWWAIYNFVGLSRTPGNITFENYHSIIATESMKVALREQQVALLSVSKDPAATDGTLISEAQSAFTEWYTRAKDNVTVVGEQAVIDEIGREYEAFTAEAEAARTALLQGQAPDFSGLTEAKNNLDTSLEQLKQLNEDSIIAYNGQAVAAARRATYSMGVISIVVVLIGVLWSSVVVTRIVNPVSRLTEGVKHIAAGERGYRIDLQTNDEIGQLAQEFTQLSEKLAEYDEENIKQLMAARSRAEAAIQSIEDPILLINRDFSVYSMNSTASGLFGLAERDAVGRHFLESINRPDIFTLIKRAMEGEDNPAERDNVMEMELDSKQHYYSLKVSPIGDDENIVGVLLLFRDVTKFEEINQMKSDFVSTVSHEFRTPLTSIMMGVGLVMEEEMERLSEPAQTMIKVAMDEAQQLNKLVNELLDLSRIESGRIEMEIEPVNVQDLHEPAARPLIPQMKDMGIEYESVIPEDFPKLKADPNKIAWVLSNLLSNAMRYTPAGGKISFVAERQGSKAVLAVKDTGTGIPRHMLGKIFEKFVQVPGRGQTGGAGLGLAISKEIVLAHGGRIWVESEEGSGSAFFFTLSLAEE